MVDRVVRVVIDTTGAEAGEQRYIASLNRMKAATKGLGDADIGKVGNAIGSVASTTDNAAQSSDRLTAAQTRSTTASRNRKQALDTEAQAQSRISQMVSDSIAKYEAQAKAANDAYAAASKAPPTLVGSKSDAARQTAQMRNTSPISATDLKAAAAASDDLVSRSDRLLSTVDKGYASQTKWNKVLSEGNALYKAGAISEAEFATVQAAVTKGLSGVEEGAHVGAGAVRELITMVREAGRGDFSRLTGSSTILAQRLGLLSELTVPVVVGFGAVAGAVALVATAMITGADAQAKMQNMLEVTNETAGLTEDSLVALSQNVAATGNTTRAAAEEITSAYASTGQLSSKAIGDLSDATVTFARLTGQSNADVVASWSKIADDPIHVAEDLASKYDLVNSAGQGLTATNIQLAQRLLESGDKMGAINAIAADLKAGLSDQKENVGYLTTAWRGLAGAISGAWSAMQDWGKTKTPLDTATQKLNDLKAQKKSGYDANAYSDAMSGGLGVGNAGGANIDAQIAAQQKIVDGLKKVDDAKAASDAALANQQTAARKAVTDMTGAYSGAGDSASKLAADMKGLAVDTKAANDELARVKGLKGVTKQQVAAAQGTADYYNNNQKSLQDKIRKQDTPVKYKADNKADRDAESAAKRQAREDAEHLAAGQKYLDTLRAQGDAAAQTPIEAAKTLAIQSETEKLGERIAATAQGKAMIEQAGAAAQQKYVSKTLDDAKKDNDQAARNLAAKQAALGLTDKQAAMQEAADKERADLTAKLADAQGKVTSAAQTEINIQVERAKTIAGQTYDLQKQAELLKNMGQYSPHAAQQDKLTDLKSQQASLNDPKTMDALIAKYGSDMAKTIFDETTTSLGDAVQATNDTFRNKFADSIEQLGDQISGKWGKAISAIGQTLSGIINAGHGDFSGLGPIGSLLGAFKGSNNSSLQGIATSAAATSKSYADDLLGGNGKKSALLDPATSLKTNFKGFTDDMKGIFANKNGSFQKGLGDVLGKAGAGVKMGDQVDSFMKALGLKSSKLGSEIGGGLGSAIAGPIGGLIGSIGGGLIGGLLKSAPKGGTTIKVDSYGNATKGDSTGNNAAAITASQGAATSVGSGLSTIAQTLGGQLTGTPNVTIGEYNGKWRVNTQGTKLGGSSSPVAGLTDFGKDGQADAIQYAIEAALKQGVLTGISNFSQQVLKNATDIDAATKLAAQYENVLKDIATYEDPVKASADTLQKTFQTLSDQMAANGATASDLANVEKDYDYQRKAAMKDALSDLETFKEKLNGTAGGQSNINQLNTDLAQFRAYESDISSGKTVDQSDFSTLGSSILDLSNTIYGNTTQQNGAIVAELQKYNSMLEANITGVFNADTLTSGSSTSSSSTDAVVAAVNNQVTAANASYAAQQQTNTLLQTLINTVQANGGSVTTKNGVYYVNGQVIS